MTRLLPLLLLALLVTGRADRAGAEETGLEPWSIRLKDGKLRLHGGRGEVVTTLAPVIRVKRKGAREQVVKVGAWAPAGKGFEATAATSHAAWRVRVDGLELAATMTQTTPAALARASIELFLPGKASALDRAYRNATLPVLADRFSPQVARVGQVTVLGNALEWRVSPAKGGALVRLFVDDAAAHPLELWSRCVDDPSVKPRKKPHGAATWKARDQAEVRLRLLPGAGRVPVPLRYPEGYKAAFVFTDHADQANAAKLGALMYGKATRAAPIGHRGGQTGFVNRGLAMTKTVFAFHASGYPHQMDDAHFVPLVEALAADGQEIGPHSASGAKDTPRRTQAALELLARFRPATWIDHQPNTNCEALMNEGARDGTWNSLAALEQAGYRYAWEGDVPLPAKELNLFRAAAKRASPAVLYRHPRTGKLWLFRALWKAMSRRRFLAGYSRRALDRLVAERGLHIAHTYLDIYTEKGTERDAWTLLREASGGGYELTEEADALFAGLQARQARHELWVAPMRAVGDHLLAVSQLDWNVDRGAFVVRSEQAVAGLTVLWPDGHERVVDLPAGETVRVEP